MVIFDSENTISKFKLYSELVHFQKKKKKFAFFVAFEIKIGQLFIEFPILSLDNCGFMHEVTVKK